MKLVVVGLGQCGCNIADQFYAVNSYAKSFFEGHREILTDAFAINTDETDLSSFKNIPKDTRHRILIGSLSSFGHGVGKINTEAAKIMKETNSAVTDAILGSSRFSEADAIIAVASGGGGTGSGVIGVLIKELKERTDKPIYAIVVLPFEFEERGDRSRAVMNTATCLNTVTKYANGTFLLDNERFRRTGGSLSQNLAETNWAMVSGFFDLCCAGEEHNQKYIGSKVIDAGDIMQSLSGITTLGRGGIELSFFYKWHKDGFSEGTKERNSAAGALRQAENNLGLAIDLKDARRILALVSAPKDVLSVTILDEISGYLQQRSPKAEVRIGDSPRRDREVSVTIVASELTSVSKVESLNLLAQDLFAKEKQIEQETKVEVNKMMETAKNLPSLD